MPKRIIGVTERLVAAAETEFMEKGYGEASIRTIAEKADTSPRAVYTRFKNKEELFAAIVEPVHSAFMELYHRERAAYWKRAGNLDFSVEPEETYLRYLRFAYEHRKEFLLILTCAQGTRYQDLPGRLAREDIEGVRANVPQYLAKTSVFPFDEAMDLFVENITIDFYNALFVPVIKDLPYETACAYVAKLTRFYSFGILDSCQDSLSPNQLSMLTDHGKIREGAKE